MSSEPVGVDTTQRGIVKSPQDFAAGLFLLFFAGLCYYGAYDLKFGQMRGIGPGLMPKVTAFMLGAFGVLLLIIAMLSRGSLLERWSIRGPFFVLGGVLLFALTIRGASFESVAVPFIGTIPLGLKFPSLGLLVSGPLVVIVSSFADKDTRPLEVLIYAAVITAFCIGLFKYLLRLPIPLAPWWLGY